MKLSNPVLRLRQHLELSQRALAQRIEVSSAYISKLETSGEGMGKESALRTTEEFRREMKVAGITLADLLRGSDCVSEPAGDAV